MAAKTIFFQKRLGLLPGKYYRNYCHIPREFLPALAFLIFGVMLCIM
jgi:hypothetical protein